MGEGLTLRCETVEVRRMNQCLAKAANFTVTKIVGHDMDDIVRLFLGWPGSRGNQAKRCNNKPLNKRDHCGRSESILNPTMRDVVVRAWYQ